MALDPEEILNGGQYSKKPREVANMLERHGFVLVRAKKHDVYKHPHFDEIPFRTLAHSNNSDVDPGAVVDAAKACMRVKELNAARRAGGGVHWMRFPIGWSRRLSMDSSKRSMPAT